MGKYLSCLLFYPCAFTIKIQFAFCIVYFGKMAYKIIERQNVPTFCTNGKRVCQGAQCAANLKPHRVVKLLEINIFNVMYYTGSVQIVSPQHSCIFEEFFVFFYLLKILLSAPRVNQVLSCCAHSTKAALVKVAS